MGRGQAEELLYGELRPPQHKDQDWSPKYLGGAELYILFEAVGDLLTSHEGGERVERYWRSLNIMISKYVHSNGVISRRTCEEFDLGERERKRELQNTAIWDAEEQAIARKALRRAEAGKVPSLERLEARSVLELIG